MKARGPVTPRTQPGAAGPMEAEVATRRRTPHPGRTKAQRAVLDAIGCGDCSPYMAPRTRDALLAAGLIIECGEKVVGRDRFGLITIPEYGMPIPVHMQWCYAVSDDDADDPE